MGSYALILVDVQKKLIPAMRGEIELVNNLQRLVKGFNLFNLPIIVTEQVPDKLGETVNDLRGALNGKHFLINKSEFSCLGNEVFYKKIKTLSLDTKLILCGIETHICVFQTARDLIKKNYKVKIVTDGVSSRKKNDNDTALKVLDNIGAGLTTVEMLLFDILKNANDENFKKLSSIIK